EVDNTVLELTTVTEPSGELILAPREHPDAAEPVEAPALAASEIFHHPEFEHPILSGMEQLAPAAMMARDETVEDLTDPPSYLSAARQSLQAAAVRSDGESVGKDLFRLR